MARGGGTSNSYSPPNDRNTRTDNSGMAPERPVQPVSQGIQPAAQPVQPKPESSIPIYDKPPTNVEKLVRNIE